MNANSRSACAREEVRTRLRVAEGLSDGTGRLSNNFRSTQKSGFGRQMRENPDSSCSMTASDQTDSSPDGEIKGTRISLGGWNPLSKLRDRRCLDVAEV